MRNRLVLQTSRIAAIALALLLASSSAHASTIYGNPTYPPDGGVTFSGSGSPILTGGGTFSLSGHDIGGAVDQLWYGLSQLPQLSMDGASYTGAENLSFDIGTSNLAAGVARWTGSGLVTISCNVGCQTVGRNIRFTLTVGGAGAASGFVPETDLLSVDPGYTLKGIDVVAPITGDFTANLLFEVDVTGSGSWQAVGTWFNGQQTQSGGPWLYSSVGTGYLWTVPEPGTLLLLSLGLLGLARTGPRR